MQGLYAERVMRLKNLVPLPEWRAKNNADDTKNGRLLMED